VTKTLRDNGFRTDFDLRNEKIGFKIREHTLQRVPYLLVVGDRELQTGTLAVRDRTGQDLGTLGIEDFIARLSGEVVNRSH
jgi:threonyl-tRNA synthetase